MKREEWWHPATRRDLQAGERLYQPNLMFSFFSFKQEAIVMFPQFKPLSKHSKYYTTNT